MRDERTYLAYQNNCSAFKHSPSKLTTAYKQQNLGCYKQQSTACMGTCSALYLKLREQFGSYGLSSHVLNITTTVPWVTCFLSCPFSWVKVTPAVHYFVSAEVLF